MYYRVIYLINRVTIESGRLTRFDMIDIQKYWNMPEQLLKELQTYVDGELLYIPKASSKKEWGTVNGSRMFYQERNKEIQRLFQAGSSVEALANQYGLAYSTIKKIVYC